MKEVYKFSFDVYDSINDLPEQDASLLKQAIEATKHSYAPYSHFHVGAVARLGNGEFVSGTNQENASFPVGICAERVLLSAASSLFPNIPIDTVAISYNNLKGPSDHPISPCGICRQSLVEYEARLGNIRIILAGMQGEVYVIEKAAYLLPLGFTSGDMG